MFTELRQFKAVFGFYWFFPFPFPEDSWSLNRVFLNMSALCTRWALILKGDFDLLQKILNGQHSRHSLRFFKPEVIDSTVYNSANNISSPFSYKRLSANKLSCRGEEIREKRIPKFLPESFFSKGSSVYGFANLLCLENFSPALLGKKERPRSLFGLAREI